MKAGHFLTFCILLCYGSDASAYVFKGRPNCPTNNGFKTSWLDWVTAQKKDLNNGFSIFLYKQSPKIGVLKPGKCHTSFGSKNGIKVDQSSDKGFREVSLGKIDADTMSFTYGKHKLSFNEAGDLFHHNYGLVGMFKCTLGTNC
ncbi:hypothetical protein E0H39_35720 [Rhizobium leguminosarum bv. viciae]|uniref:hypothetical protein n=1 Tax=Rhizobium leguminosarum TaxID=384 RepID=UPI00103942D1|nr:hypothetical protein [Rhizobium leguminosarum]NEJ80359.1 hypothetical protein [Rhizobium leguminosarum]TBY54128.1 hypothetical protein E0H39_35720 [Rhizobium leguminosarum bv. viciae]